MVHLHRRGTEGGADAAAIIGFGIAGGGSRGVNLRGRAKQVLAALLGAILGHWFPASHGCCALPQRGRCEFCARPERYAKDDGVAVGVTGTERALEYDGGGSRHWRRRAVERPAGGPDDEPQDYLREPRSGLFRQPRRRVVGHYGEFVWAAGVHDACFGRVAFRHRIDEPTGRLPGRSQHFAFLAGHVAVRSSHWRIGLLAHEALKCSTACCRQGGGQPGRPGEVGPAPGLAPEPVGVGLVGVD